MKMKETRIVKHKFFTRTVLIILAGSAMIAHGLRMMIQGLFFPNSFYPAPLPTSFDFWFDWFTLYLLGIIIIYIASKQWIQWLRNQKHKKSNKKKSLIMPT